MKTTKHGRIEYLDIARAYLISLVVLGHVLIVLNPGYDRLLLTAAQEFIASFHMPAFFMIHGILLGGRPNTAINLRTMIDRRIRTLLVPYLFFEVIGMLSRRIIYGQSLMTGLFNMITIRCNVGADWFLPALFMGNLLCTLLMLRQRLSLQVASVCGSILLAMLLPDTQFFIVLGRSLLGYSFIMLGYLLRALFASPTTPGIGKTILALALTGICSIINMKWGTNDFFSCTVRNPLTLVLAGISGTYLILSIARHFTHHFLSKIGEQSLIIMGTHQLAIYAMTRLLPGMRGGNLLWGILLTAGILVFEMMTVCFLNRYFRVFLGK